MLVVAALPAAADHPWQFRVQGGKAWLSDGTQWIEVGGASVRKSVRFLTSSNAAVAIPSWAQNGGGCLFVSGCGGGGGATGATSYGGSGAWATRHQILIPSGATTLSATVGTAGSSVGGAGGASTITIGGTVALSLGGGAGSSSGAGGKVAIYGADPFSCFQATASTGGTLNDVAINNIGLTGVLTAIALQNTVGEGRRGHSPAGTLDAPLPYKTASSVRPTTPYGGNSGYGYGGISGAGGPGMLLLEFEEWPT